MCVNDVENCVWFIHISWELCPLLFPSNCWMPSPLICCKWQKVFYIKHGCVRLFPRRGGGLQNYYCISTDLTLFVTAQQLHWNFKCFWEKNCPLAPPPPPTAHNENALYFFSLHKISTPSSINKNQFKYFKSSSVEWQLV